MKPDKVIVIFNKVAYLIHSVHPDDVLANKALSKLRMTADNANQYGIMTLQSAINWMLYKECNR